MDDILFTCAGTSDPVRGNRDGGILHIMRYYHPKRVYLFLSQQIADLEAQDHRFEKDFPAHAGSLCGARHRLSAQSFLCIIASCVTPPR